MGDLRKYKLANLRLQAATLICHRVHGDNCRRPGAYSFLLTLYLNFFLNLGPTLLFERYGVEGKNSQRFYACSACRDRKECNFFQHADAVVSEATKLAREENIKMHRPKYTHKEFYRRYCFS